LRILKTLRLRDSQKKRKPNLHILIPKKCLHKLQKPESPPDVIKLQTYFGMSPYPCTEQQRLELFWLILGECIEERKTFIFQCENEQEADELKKLTWTLVFQINDIWEVYLDDLVVKANPPKE